MLEDLDLKIGHGSDGKQPCATATCGGTKYCSCELPCWWTYLNCV